MAFGTNDIDPMAQNRGTLPKDLPAPEAPRIFGEDDIDPMANVSRETPETPWHSAVTGAGRTEFEEAPELGTGGEDVPAFSETGLRMLGAYGLSTDAKQVQDIAVKALAKADPKVAAKADKFGNPMVTFKGKDYYINKPGVSEADLFNLFAQAAAYAPASKFGAAGKSILSRMARTGAASSVTSVGTDVAAGELGSEQGVDLTKAATVGAGGALFEGLAPLAVKSWRAIFGNNRLFDKSTGRLSEEGANLAREAGLDPDTMTQKLMRSFADEAVDATDPQHAAGRAMGREFDIPYTKGQATQDWKQLAREESTRHGAFGDDAGDIMRGFDETQQTRMQGAREQVQSTVAGGERSISRPSQAGASLSEGMRGRAGRLYQQIDDAYEAARGADARISAEGVKGLTRRTTKAIRESFDLDPEINPRTVKALRNLARMERRTARQNKTGRITAVAFKQIEQERRKLNNLWKGATGSDRAALGQIRKEFDDWIDDAFDNALYSGDENALKLMKDARAKRSEYGRLFEPRDPSDTAGKVVQKIVADDLTPENVINNVFGRHGLGQKETSVQILKRVKDVVGPDSPDWAALKEAAWLRLAKDVGTDRFSPKKFATRFAKVMEENRSLVNEVFTPDEVSLMQRFRDDVMRTVTPEGATNPSRTAYTGSRLIREWLGRMGTMFTFSGSPMGGALFFTLKRAPEVMGKRAAREAVRGAGPAVPKAPAMVAPLTGAAAVGSEEIPRPNTQ